MSLPNCVTLLRMGLPHIMRQVCKILGVLMWWLKHFRGWGRKVATLGLHSETHRKQPGLSRKTIKKQKPFRDMFLSASLYIKLVCCSPL